MNIILYLGIILIAGLAAGRVINRLKLPAVTGYLLIGLLLGPSVFNLITTEKITALAPINSIALSIIAFSIGGALSLKQIKKCGKSVLVITVMQALGAYLLVTLTLHCLFGVELHSALIFGAISTATAPAATIMVLREYKAKGPLTSNLLAVVALDDALCLIAFGITMALAKILAGKVSGGVVPMIAAPLWELLGSIILGIVFAVTLLLLSSRFKENPDKMVLVLGMVFLQAGLAEFLHLSALLAGMTMGCVAVNLLQHQSEELFRLVNTVDTPIYVLFFVLAGANLQLGLLVKVGLVGVAYIFSRMIGKIGGAIYGAIISKAPAVVRKYLGLGLIPQAGVAIGLTLLVQQDLPEIANLVSTVILGSVVVYEIIGPFFAKMAIMKAGEAGVDRD
ncbi:MAG: cation:proton antiporter [Firmicutes bacterium]|nr:cation:proton antiporter [Bacillota bacterium]